MGHLYHMLSLKAQGTLWGKRVELVRVRGWGKPSQNCPLNMTEPWHSLSPSSCGYRYKTCTGLSQSTQQQAQPSAMELLTDDDLGGGAISFCNCVASISSLSSNRWTHNMCIWKALTGLSGSLGKKSTGSIERLEKSRVGIGGVRGKNVKNTLYTN